MLRSDATIASASRRIRTQFSSYHANMKSIAIYAGSFDPPGMHHREIAQRLAEHFDEVIIFPTGSRPDKPEAESLPIHRAVMADLNFGDLPRVRVELGDLERNRFTANHEFERLFGSADTELWHVVPTSVICGGSTKQSKIQREWVQGPELWHKLRFVILQESGEPFDDSECPPHFRAVAIPPHRTSELIRSQLFDGQPSEGLLYPRVADYIRRHGLFRPTPPARECLFQIEKPRFKLVVDHWNTEAVRLAEQLNHLESDQPNVIIVLGGDGTMLRAIRQHWRLRLPFYGVNLGNLGFLLNDRSKLHFWEQNLKLFQLPLLWVETLTAKQERCEALAFNDCWVERETGQTAWIEVSVNGVVRMPRVVSDGMLVSTAAGSTSYARAMGATPLPFNAPLLTLAGSNVLKPEFWHPAVLMQESVVNMRNLDPGRRPLQGFIDGVDYGTVLEMTARVSNIAAVELLFTREFDPVAKLAVLQFPQPS
jgi:NAD+ kinase